MRRTAVNRDAVPHTVGRTLSAPGPLRSQAPSRRVSVSVHGFTEPKGERPTGTESTPATRAGAGAGPADTVSVRAHAGTQANVLPLSTLGKGLAKLRVELGLASAQRHAPGAAQAQPSSPGSKAPAQQAGGAQAADPPSWPTAAARHGLYSDVPVERVGWALFVWNVGVRQPVVGGLVCRRQKPSASVCPASGACRGSTARGLQQICQTANCHPSAAGGWTACAGCWPTAGVA